MSTETFHAHGYTVVAAKKDSFVEFRIYDIVAFADMDSDVGIMWRSDDDEYVESLEQAALFAHGSVKWDGCSNWHFDVCERVMIHGCDRGDLESIGLVLAACWDWAKSNGVVTGA